MKARALLPLGIFLALIVLLGVGLTLKPREIPSALIDKPAPDFRLTDLQAPDRTVTLADLRGQVWMLNVWASWCVGCREEHHVLVDLAGRKLAPLVGLNYKDKRDDALAWLAQEGNPYVMSIADPEGRTGIDYGVYGVPETFLIDGAGRIRYKHIGPLTPESLERELLPRLAALQKG